MALWRRHESEHRRDGDAQAGVVRWTEALTANPNQYIWRRRIQQYGPRLDKPYNFYFWVAEARKEIRDRGEEPFPRPPVELKGVQAEVEGNFLPAPVKLGG